MKYFYIFSFFHVSFFLLVFFLWGLTPDLALGQDVDRTTAQFFESVMSPYCPGMTLSACPSEDARLLRDEIRGKLEKGISKEQVEADLTTRFGNLSGGPAKGATGSLSFLGILVFFVIGVGMIVFNIRRDKKVNDV